MTKWIDKCELESNCYEKIDIWAYTYVCKYTQIQTHTHVWIQQK